MGCDTKYVCSAGVIASSKKGYVSEASAGTPEEPLMEEKSENMRTQEVLHRPFVEQLIAFGLHIWHSCS